MKKNYSISGKELPEQLMEVLNELRKVFAARNIDFFIIGATARDILLEHLHKSGIRQSTMDVDFAVYVPDCVVLSMYFKLPKR